MDSQNGTVSERRREKFYLEMERKYVWKEIKGVQSDHRDDVKNPGQREKKRKYVNLVSLIKSGHGTV